MFAKDPKKYQHGTLNTLNYKHPKFCYYVDRPNKVFRVIGYHFTINQYKIQNTEILSEFLMVDPFDISGIWDKGEVDKLSTLYGK